MKGSKKIMYDALFASFGNVSEAVKKANIGRATHYKWMNQDPEYKEAIEGLEDVTHDFVEHQLLKSINEGDKTSIIFYLKTKAKHRGYVERQEVQHGGEIGFRPVNIEVVEDKSAGRLDDKSE